MPERAIIEVNGTEYTISDVAAIKFDRAQTLTAEQKAQARTNIGADEVAGTVRYDQAQTLTAAQKTQAQANIGVDTLEARVADLEYVPISITSFVISTPANGIAEIGSTVYTEVLRWTLEGTPVSQTIDGTAHDVNTRETTLAGPGNTYTSDHEFVLVVTDAGSPSHTAATAQKTATLRFYNNVHYGAAALGAVDSAFVNGLANKTLTGSKARTITVNAGSGQYIWYAVPKRLGTCNFNVGGFDGGFEAPQTVSVTNASGYTEDYYVYRSTNASLGNTTVKVT